MNCLSGVVNWVSNLTVCQCSCRSRKQPTTAPSETDRKTSQTVVIHEIAARKTSLTGPGLDRVVSPTQISSPSPPKINDSQEVAVEQASLRIIVTGADKKEIELTNQNGTVSPTQPLSSPKAISSPKTVRIQNFSSFQGSNPYSTPIGAESTATQSPRRIKDSSFSNPQLYSTTIRAESTGTQKTRYKSLTPRPTSDDGFVVLPPLPVAIAIPSETIIAPPKTPIAHPHTRSNSEFLSRRERQARRLAANHA